MWYFIISQNRRGTSEREVCLCIILWHTAPGEILAFSSTVGCRRAGRAVQHHRWGQGCRTHGYGTMAWWVGRNRCSSQISCLMPIISKGIRDWKRLITKEHNLTMSEGNPAKFQRNQGWRGTAPSARPYHWAVAFVFLLSIMHTLPFPLNDLVMFVPSHCAQTLQIKIASHLKKNSSSFVLQRNQIISILWENSKGEGKASGLPRTMAVHPPTDARISNAVWLLREIKQQ